MTCCDGAGAHRCAVITAAARVGPKVAGLLLAVWLSSAAMGVAQRSTEDQEFVDPTEGEPPAATVDGLLSRVPSVLPRSPIDPLRQTDRWELAASAFAFFPFLDDGVGVITRAHLTYRFELPLMVRAEASPLGLSAGTTGLGAGAFGLFSFGVDLHAFGATVGLGAVSNNVHQANAHSLSEPQPGQMTALALTVRVGVSDGLAIWLRSGLAVDHRSGLTRPAVFEAWGQLPFSHIWAMRARGSWTVSGNAEARVGMRAWLEGRGEAGSVALTLDGGVGRVVYHPPVRGRGYPDALDHVGPGFGIGFEGRL